MVPAGHVIGHDIDENLEAGSVGRGYVVGSDIAMIGRPDRSTRQRGRATVLVVLVDHEHVVREGPRLHPAGHAGVAGETAGDVVEAGGQGFGPCLPLVQEEGELRHLFFTQKQNGIPVYAAAVAMHMAGADKVIAVDRDPLAFELAESWVDSYGDRLVQQRGVFSKMDEYAQDLDGVVLDLGVSSMQLDRAERGFSFLKDGPLDMRMSQEGPTAADIVNGASEETLANILFQYGEERASRRIAKAIVRARAEEPITTTLRLAGIVESCLPRAKPGQSHPATRSFQALRIAVNDEYAELYQGLMAAERALKSGGKLAVVTFHSVEEAASFLCANVTWGIRMNPEWDLVFRDIVIERDS